ncbi:MAG: HGxxPAAW family protein [Candidatus Nanopelagicales bacterium]
MAEVHHGNTVAAWTAVGVIMAAFVIGGIGVLLLNWIVFWAAVALAVLGGILGKVLQMLGFGQTRPERSAG